jgi:photosystem II stability/assembly factor-like uncharacterized protein
VPELRALDLGDPAPERVLAAFDVDTGDQVHALDRDRAAGTAPVSPDKRLLETFDGGATWTFVADLPPLAPDLMCGISVVSDSVTYVSGTNDPVNPTRMMKTLDAGMRWTAWDMRPHADLLVDNLFVDADHGFVVGGKDAVPNPKRSRSKVRAVVLHTDDGGETWTDRLADIADDLPLGEWGWKIQFLDDQVGFVALESFTRAAILKTTDGGLSWTRIEVHDPQDNANLEGIGFLDEQTGWVGGWGSASFEEGSAAPRVTAARRGGTPTRWASSSTGSGSWAPRSPSAMPRG